MRIEKKKENRDDPDKYETCQIQIFIARLDTASTPAATPNTLVDERIVFFFSKTRGYLSGSTCKLTAFG